MKQFLERENSLQNPTWNEHHHCIHNVIYLSVQRVMHNIKLNNY